MSDTDKHTGGCLCGAVRYEVKGPLRGVVNCYCSMCRQEHGSMGAYTKADKADIIIVEDRNLKWYASSDKAERGFCSQCGSGLFWKLVGRSDMGILAGTLDQPTGFETIGHIFVDEKADFLKITDEAPQYEGSSRRKTNSDEL